MIYNHCNITQKPEYLYFFSIIKKIHVIYRLIFFCKNGCLKMFCFVKLWTITNVVQDVYFTHVKFVYKIVVNDQSVSIWAFEIQVFLKMIRLNSLVKTKRFKIYVIKFYTCSQFYRYKIVAVLVYYECCVWVQPIEHTKNEWEEMTGIRYVSIHNWNERALVLEIAHLILLYWSTLLINSCKPEVTNLFPRWAKLVAQILVIEPLFSKPRKTPIFIWK